MRDRFVIQDELNLCRPMPKTRRTGNSATHVLGLVPGESAEGTVRPRRIVVPQVLLPAPGQMVLIDDQQLAGELAAQGAGHLLADGVRSGRLRRAAENPDAVRDEYGVEGPGELPCTIPGQEFD
jgi:hypothetical protein